MTVGSVKLTVVKMTVVKMRLLLLVSALLGGAPVLAADPDLVSEVFEALQNISCGASLQPERLSPPALASLSSISNINMFSQRTKEPVWPYWSLDCVACEAAGALLISLFQAGTPLWEVEVAITSLCIVLEIEAVEVCEGMVHNYGYQVEYIVQHPGSEVTAALFCGVFVGGDCGDQGTVNDWEVDLPAKPSNAAGSGPQALQDTAASLKVEDRAASLKVEDRAASLKVLQLTDVHMDLSYLPGSNPACGLPCCCMNSTGLAAEGEAVAGYWGDYSCDLPAHTFTALVQHLAETHPDIDYVIYTGDAPAHDVWLQTKEKNLEHQVAVLDTLQAFLPEVPVFLTLGNHEGFPVNSFPTGAEVDTAVSGDWLYGGLAKEPWANNLDEAARQEFSRNGFYSSLARPGLRIISLNNNFCVGMNFFMMLDFSDPADQLAWLVEELLMSEEVGEKVHILSHHPPSSCLKGWAREYTRIVNRFQSTVLAQFHGHTHDDWFLVFHDDSATASNIAFVGPSVTPYTDHNPEYRLYSVAGDASLPSFGYVTDHETWSMDLSLLGGQEDLPVWRHLYSASSDLGLAGSSPADWQQILVRAQEDPALFERLALYYHQNRPGALPDMRGFLCRMVWNIDCPF